MTNNLHHAIKNLSYQWIINKDQMVILVLKIDKFALNYLTFNTRNRYFEIQFWNLSSFTEVYVF